jgi:organic radical activating enzyme
MQVIPRIQFDDEKSLEFCLLGIPKNPPMVAISVQNFGTEDKNKKEDEKQVTKIIQMALDKVEPTKNVIIYGGNPAKRVLESLDLHGAVGVHIENYAAVRRGTVFDKKDGVSKLTATQKKRLKDKVQHEEAARLGVSLDELKKNTPIDDEDF